VAVLLSLPALGKRERSRRQGGDSQSQP